MFADIENELNIALIYHPADKLLFSFCCYLGWNALCFSAIGCYEIADGILADSRAADNMGFAIAGMTCFVDTLVVNQTLVLRMNFSGENRQLLKPANR